MFVENWIEFKGCVVFVIGGIWGIGEVILCLFVAHGVIVVVGYVGNCERVEVF